MIFLLNQLKRRSGNNWFICCVKMFRLRPRGCFFAPPSAPPCFVLKNLEQVCRALAPATDRLATAAAAAVIRFG